MATIFTIIFADDADDDDIYNLRSVISQAHGDFHLDEATTKE